MIITGYHGTSKEYGNEIINNKKFNKSTGKEQWLGTGIYFYRGYEDALNWAKKYHGDIMVIHAVINLENDKYIDLDSSIGRAYYRKAVEILKGFDYISRGTAQENQCAIANFIWQEWSYIQLIMAAFPTEPSAFKMLKDAREYRKEFCIRDNKYIKAINYIDCIL